eukprot:s1350_g15.t1
MVPRGSTLSEDQFSMMLAHSFINTRKRPSLQMLWEKGVARKIFCRDKTELSPAPQATVDWVGLDGAAFMQTSEIVEDVDSRDMEFQGHYFEKAIAVISDKTFEEQRCEQLNDAVEKWLCILLLRPEASETGKLIEQSLESDLDKSGARKTISAILGAKVLTVEQVKWLHQTLTADATHPVDRSFVGYILTALYGRCRHSDLAMIDRVDCDFDNQGGFIEIQTRVHKTSRQAAQKTVLLPIVIPAIGVDGEEWITAAQQAFDAVGLSLSGEATTLSWTAKACVGPADQAILGRHSSAYAETSTVYSRDASIRAVSQHQAVIEAIRSGEFMPDCPRSNYRPRVEAEASTVGPTKEEEDQWSLVGNSEPAIDPEDEVVHLFSSDEDSEESCETSDSEAEGLPVPKCTRHVLSEATSKLFVRHRVSKLVHFKATEVGTTCKVLSCGRSLNGNYEAVDRFDTVDMCKRCREMARKDGVLQQP